MQSIENLPFLSFLYSASKIRTHLTAGKTTYGLLRLVQKLSLLAHTFSPASSNSIFIGSSFHSSERNTYLTASTFHRNPRITEISNGWGFNLTQPYHSLESPFLSQRGRLCILVLSITGCYLLASFP